MSRNLKELLTFLEELGEWGIGFKSATEPFDTTSSAGKLAIQMLGSYAEFERNRLIERVFPGMIMGVKKGHWQGAELYWKVVAGAGLPQQGFESVGREIKRAYPFSVVIEY